MRKKCLLLSILLLLPLSVKANIICNDGTTSATCTDCHTGCCSRHGGCTDSPNNGGGGGYSQSNDGYQQQNNYYSEPQPVVPVTPVAPDPVPEPVPEPNTPIENNTDSILEESSNNEVEEKNDNDESNYVESNDESNDSEITNHNDTSDSDDTGSGIVGLGVLGGLGYLFFKKKSKR